MENNKNSPALGPANCTINSVIGAIVLETGAGSFLMLSFQLSKDMPPEHQSKEHVSTSQT